MSSFITRMWSFNTMYHGTNSIVSCMTKFRFPRGRPIQLTDSGGSGHASGLFALRHKRLLGAALREEVERRERVKRRPGVELSARLVAGGGLGPEGAQRVEVFEEGDGEVDGEVREPVGLGGNVLSWLEVVGREG